MKNREDLDGVKVKATSTEELHKMAVDFIQLGKEYAFKNPNFAYTLEVDHMSMRLEFKAFKYTEDE